MKRKLNVLMDVGLLLFLRTTFEVYFSFTTKGKYDKDNQTIFSDVGI